MAQRLLNNAAGRLRFALANPQPLPIAAGIMAIAVLTVQLFVLPRMEAMTDENEINASRLERTTRRILLEHPEEASSPVDARQRLLERFPTEEQLNAELGRILDIASRQGVQIPGGDYTPVKNKDGLFDRYVINLPAKGSYRAIREYVQAVRTELPDLAVEDMSLRRDAIGNGDIEAQLRFVLYGRRNAK